MENPPMMILLRGIPRSTSHCTSSASWVAMAPTVSLSGEFGEICDLSYHTVDRFPIIGVYDPCKKITDPKARSPVWGTTLVAALNMM
ncbi:hypothetical protein MAR_000993 [Mya arenaria]|uniref:Uncharacterized protein n=1 Tax=Mya arenaria TaxID=6604 RepID=A0ABY7FAM9_MYAAR|nr:hypothetical protein MAR_000993 [Mya arenaria]